MPDEAARTDYGVIAFTDDQWARLQAVFSTGVCDELAEFVATAQRESGRSLTAGQAVQLVAGARDIQVLLGC